MSDSQFQNGEEELLASSCLSVRLSARPPHEGQHGSHRTCCNEIWYLRIFRKSIEKILVSLKSENNNGYFTLRPTYLRDNVSTNSSKNDKFFGQKLYRKSKRTLYIEDLFPENRAVYGVMWKKKNCTTGLATDDNMAQGHSMYPVYLRLQTHSQNM